MTVQTNTNSISYVGNGSTVHFDYDFLILDASHLKVYFEDALQTSGYVVSGVLSQTGGTVAFASAPGVGVKITLTRSVPFLQLTDYQPYDAFPADSHERALDLLTMMAQQLKDASDRSMQYPVGGDKWDAKGNEIINVGDGGSDTSAPNIGQVKSLIALLAGPDSAAQLRADLAEDSGLSIVGFSPALPGSENVNASRFLPQTSPLSYGAFFNGTDDDTAGINKAIAAKGPNQYCMVRFPEGANAKIAGTVLVPSGVKVDLNGCIVNGVGTNTLFEGGKWVGSSVVSNFNDAPETSLVVDAWIGNGLVQECMSAVKINNWVAGCRVHNLRGYHVNQMLHEKRSFYCEFHNLMAWEPLNGTLLPCFHWETAIQAQGAKRCFAVGYTKGHTIQGPNDMESFDTCGAEGCVDGVYITGTASLGGGGSGLTLRNWYLENNGTAIKADPAYNYENVDIDNCFFNENFVTLEGPTILSGRFGRMNKVKTSVARPGNVNMLGNQAGLKGFIFELEEIADSVNRTTPTIDTVGRFFVGPNVRIERVVTLTNGSGLPYARNVESPSIPVERITGNQFGVVPNNTVPFCETFYSAPTLNVKTQVPYQDFAMVSYNIAISDNTGGPYWVRGVVMGDQVFPLSVGQKTVTLQNSGGFLQLNISAFTGAATYRGVVKHL